jgi:hypothetical protein
MGRVQEYWQLNESLFVLAFFPALSARLENCMTGLCLPGGIFINQSTSHRSSNDFLFRLEFRRVWQAPFSLKTRKLFDFFNPKVLQIGISSENSCFYQSGKRQRKRMPA